MTTYSSRSLTLSFAIHAAVAFFVFLILWAPPFWAPSSLTEEIPFEVIEAPRVAPQPLEAVQPKKKQTQPRAVFGLSRKSWSSSDENAPQLKAGNTTAKAPDQEKLRDSDVDSLPIPTDDYLVSSMPELLSDFRVPYPADAKKAGIQGSVILDLLIDPEGRVRQASVVQKLFPSLDQAALEAATKLRFKPARVADQSVAVRIRYAYRFILE